MEKSVPLLPIESFKDNETLLYFATLNDDERLEDFLERGDRIADFNFIGRSDYAIHHQLLPKNHHNEDGSPITAFQVSGYYTNGTSSSFHATLTSTEGHTPHSFVIEAKDESSIYIYEKDSEYIDFLDLSKFRDLSLRAGNIQPSKARQALRQKNDEMAFSSLQDIYTYWGELTQEREGQFTDTRYTSQPISSDENKTVEIRLLRSEHELPYQTIRDIVVEHATQLHDLDAEIVYRLELRYESLLQDKHGFDAQKRVVSGIERELVNARLTSRDTSGTVTPLDISDSTIMKQFQGALEVALSV
jgi:hypothetical protein